MSYHIPVRLITGRISEAQTYVIDIVVLDLIDSLQVDNLGCLAWSSHKKLKSYIDVDDLYSKHIQCSKLYVALHATLFSPCMVHMATLWALAYYCYGYIEMPHHNRHCPHLAPSYRFLSTFIVLCTKARETSGISSEESANVQTWFSLCMGTGSKCSLDVHYGAKYIRFDSG